MKNERIFNAVGKISDDLIEDAAISKMESCPKSKKTEQQWLMPASRRAFRLGIAVALIACLLGTAVFATTSWLFNGFNAKVGDSWEAVTPTEPNGNSHSGSVYELSFYLPISENAPDPIETFYFPQIPDAYKHSFGYAYAGMNYDRLGAIVYAWDIPNGETHGMMFYQESGFDSNLIEFHAVGTPNCAPELKEVVLGDVEGVLIVETIDFGFPHKYFFWSDGDYVFHMRFPVDFPENQMAEIVGTVDRVEDVQQYLISMTDEELKKTFD